MSLLCDYDNKEGSDERVVYLSNSSGAKDKVAPKSNPLSGEGKTERLHNCIPEISVFVDLFMQS